MSKDIKIALMVDRYMLKHGGLNRTSIMYKKLLEFGLRVNSVSRRDAIKEVLKILDLKLFDRRKGIISKESSSFISKLYREVELLEEKK